MLAKEYEGSVCEIKTLRNAFITAGRVEMVGESEMEIVDPTGPLPIIAYKTPVKIAVFNSALGFKMMAGQIYTSNPQVLKIINVLDFLEYERRRFFRLDIDAAGVLMLEKRDEAGAPTGEYDEIPVRVKNLSLCGAMFESKKVLHTGDQVRLRMPLHRNSIEILTTIVQRTREWEEGEYSYGVEIVDLNNRLEQNLCAYLFDQQRLQIQRMKSHT